LHVRAVAVGYQSVDATLDLSKRQRELDTTLILPPHAQRLAPIEVTAGAPRSIGKLLDFERRRKVGFGSFLDRDQLAAWEPIPLSTVLRSLRGTALVPRAWMCGGGFAAGSTRSAVRAPCVVMPACFFAVYVDGIRVYDPDGTTAPPNVDDFLTDQVEAIEVYRGAGETPIEYQGTGGACGALVIWTRVSGVPR
jgi:hypothetical protein